MSHYSCQAGNIVHANFTRVPAYWDTSCPRVVRQDYENVKKVILTLYLLSPCVVRQDYDNTRKQNKEIALAEKYAVRLLEEQLT